MRMIMMIAAVVGVWESASAQLSNALWTSAIAFPSNQYVVKYANLGGFGDDSGVALKIEAYRPSSLNSNRYDIQGYVVWINGSGTPFFEGLVTNFYNVLSKTVYLLSPLRSDWAQVYRYDEASNPAGCNLLRRHGDTIEVIALETNLQSSMSGAVVTGGSAYTPFLYSVAIDSSASQVVVKCYGSSSGVATNIAVLSASGYEGGNYVIEWTTGSGLEYQIQSSSNVTEWIDVGGRVVGTGAPIRWMDAMTNGRRNYRVVIQQ